MAAWVSPPEPADSPAREGGSTEDAWSKDLDRNDGADDALDAAERGCASTVPAPLASGGRDDATAKPVPCRTPTAASPVSSGVKPANQVRAARAYNAMLPGSHGALACCRAQRATCAAALNVTVPAMQMPSAIVPDLQRGTRTHRD